MSKARAFSVFGSASIGDGLWLMYGSWPFVRIRVSEAEITLWMGWKRFCLGKESISRIRQYNVWFQRGVLVEHAIPDYPRFIFFCDCICGFRRRRLVAKLRDQGYPVEDGVVWYIFDLVS